jgi:hypothetical protein
MTMHDAAQAQEHSTPNPSALMTLWLSSGGALDAVAAVDNRTAGTARSRQHGYQADDDGLYSIPMFTTNPFACAETGLQSSNVTKDYGCIPPSVDDGLVGGNVTSSPLTCADDGLRAADFSGRMPHNCADDGLVGGNVTTSALTCVDD